MNAMQQELQGQTLSEVVSLGQLSATHDVLTLIYELSKQIAASHHDGLLHLDLCLDSISMGPDGMKLADRSESVDVRPMREMLDWPATELRKLPSRLSTDVAEARQQLNAAGLSLDPRNLDWLSVGDILCRLFSGQPLSDYRCSPRVKGSIPASVRPVIERILGIDGQTRYADCHELLKDLSGLLSQTRFDPSLRPSPDKKKEGDTAMTGVASPWKRDDTAGPVRRAAAPEDSRELPFQKLGHFEIHSRIGHGGMGDVYRAFDPSLNRTVAIKVLPAEFARQSDFIQRFRAEATAAAQLIHPNIVQIYFIGEDSGHYFFAMQFVDGVSLATLLEQQQRLECASVVALVEQVLRGLQEAHTRGFVHRDIKPGNILIDDVRKMALLADFGLVKQANSTSHGLTATGVVLGTVDYISPEQARGHDVDGRADLYSIGVLMYRMLSGELPFHADSATSLIFQHVYEQPRLLHEVVPNVPEPLSSIVARLLKKSPDERYQSAQEVLADLEAFRLKRPLPSVELAAETSAEVRPVESSLDMSTLPEIPRLPSGIMIRPSRQDWWSRIVQRLQVAFHRHAPQLLQDLQSTQQQVDGALAIYESRRDELRQLVSEAESTRDDLAQSVRLLKGHPDEEALARQLKEHEEQIDDMRLKLAKVESTWQQLRAQRDLLNARLKSAGARLRIEGATASAPSRQKQLIAVAGSAVAIMAVITLFEYYRNVPATQSIIGLPLTPFEPVLPSVATAPSEIDWPIATGPEYSSNLSSGIRYLQLENDAWTSWINPENVFENLSGVAQNRFVWKVRPTSNSSARLSVQSDGVRIQLPAAPAEREPVIIEGMFAVIGDFDIQMEYWIRQFQRPKKEFQNIELFISGEFGKAAIMRTNSSKMGDGYALWYEPADRLDRSGDWKVIPTKAKQGTLRLRRMGTELQFLAPGESNTGFIQIGQIQIGAGPLNSVATRLYRTEMDVPTEISIHKVSIKAGEILPAFSP